MKIRKIALLGLGLLALSVAPVMAFGFEMGVEGNASSDGASVHTVHTGVAVDATTVAHGGVAEEGSAEGAVEVEEESHGEGGVEMEYHHRERIHYEAHGYLEEGCAGGYDEGVHLLITAEGHPVRAVAYVVADGIVQEVDTGASIHVESDGELYIAVVGYPLTELDTSSIKGDVEVDVSTGEVTPLEGCGEGLEEGSGAASGAVREEHAQSAKRSAEHRERARVISQEELKIRIQHMLHLESEGAKVAEVKVKAENGHKVYVAVVKKPFRIGPIVLPFEMTEEVEIPEEEVEAEAYGEGSVRVS